MNPEYSTSNQEVFPASESKLPNIKNLLSRSWDLYKSRFKVFFGILLIPIAMAYLSVLFLLSSAFFVSFADKLGLFAPILITLAIIIFICVLMIVNLWGQVALVYSIKHSEEGIGVKESYKIARGKIGSYLWVNVLLGLVALGGFFLFIIPAIIFVFFYSLAMFVLVTEDTKGVNALVKSKFYVKGNWFKVFSRFVVVWVIMLPIVLVPSVLLRENSSEIFTNTYSLIINLLITPFIFVYSFLLFSDLKTLKSDTGFEPSKKERRLVKFFATFGAVAIIAIPTLVFVFAPKPPVNSNEPIQNLTMQDIERMTKEEAKTPEGRDQQRARHIDTTQMGLYLYRTANNTYPENIETLYDGYLPFILKDPSTGESYSYERKNNGTDFELCATMELVEKLCVNSSDQFTSWQERPF